MRPWPHRQADRTMAEPCHTRRAWRQDRTRPTNTIYRSTRALFNPNSHCAHAQDHHRTLLFLLQSHNPSHRPKSPILISILIPLGASNRVSAAARWEQSHRRTGCPRENGKQELNQIRQLIQYNPALPPSSHYFATAHASVAAGCLKNTLKILHGLKITLPGNTYF